MPQLIRFPILFTALADVLAGYFVFTAITQAPRLFSGTLILLAIISLGLYAGGMIFNRLVAQNQLSTEISPAVVFLSACTLFLVSLFVAETISLATMILTSSIIILWIAYNFYTRESIFLGSFNLGLVRGFNFLLGTTAFAPRTAPGLAYLTFPLVPFIYTFLVTLLSHLNERGSRKTLIFFFMIILTGTILFPLWLVRYKMEAAWLNLLIAIYFLVRLWQILHPSPDVIRRHDLGAGGVTSNLTTASTLAIIPLEASLVFGYDLIIPGLIMLGIWLIGVVLTKTTSS